LVHPKQQQLLQRQQVITIGRWLDYAGRHLLGDLFNRAFRPERYRQSLLNRVES